MTEEKEGYHLYDAGNWEPSYWEPTTKVFLNLDDAKSFAASFKSKTKIDVITVIL